MDVTYSRAVWMAHLILVALLKEMQGLNCGLVGVKGKVKLKYLVLTR